MKQKKPGARDIGFYVLILVILLATIFSLTSTGNAESVQYSDVETCLSRKRSNIL